MTTRRAVTIHDVAREAGVSKSTVSRILDERRPMSSSPAAERVREAALRLGYRRDRSASALRRQQTGTIGVLVPRLSDAVMAMFFEEVARACQDAARFAIVATTGDEPTAEWTAAESLLAQGVDGLIMTTARGQDDAIARLRAQDVPLVLALRTDHVTPASLCDDELGGYLATRHLLDLGHRRIGLIAGPDHASSAQGRRAGYRRALEEAGVAVDPDLVRPSSFGMESGATEGAALLAYDVPPTAIFAVNDNTAVGVLAAAQQRGLSVPADLSVVGYNDIPLSARLPVALTTVKVPLDHVARSAVEMLRAILDGRPVQGDRVAMPTLIPRDTTAAPAPSGRGRGRDLVG